MTFLLNAFCLKHFSTLQRLNVVSFEMKIDSKYYWVTSAKCFYLILVDLIYCFVMLCLHADLPFLV